MENIKTITQQIYELGKTDQEIADLLNARLPERKTKVHQTTITRIRNGDTEAPGSDLGLMLLNIRNELAA